MTLASYSLQAYSVGLLAFMLIKVLAPGYFSRQDTKTPVKIGIIAMLANMGLNIVFVVPLHFYWQIGHVGLALATAASAFLNAGLLYLGLRRAGVYQPMPGFALSVLRLMIAALVMVVALLWLKPDAALWADWVWWQRAINIGWLCGAGFVAYALTLLLSGVRPRHFKAHSSTNHS